jgi:hypothetical protein
MSLRIRSASRLLLAPFITGRLTTPVIGQMYSAENVPETFLQMLSPIGVGLRESTRMAKTPFVVPRPRTVTAVAGAFCFVACECATLPRPPGFSPERRIELLHLEQPAASIVPVRRDRPATRSLA